MTEWLKAKSVVAVLRYRLADARDQAIAADVFGDHARSLAYRAQVRALECELAEWQTRVTEEEMSV